MICSWIAPKFMEMFFSVGLLHICICIYIAYFLPLNRACLTLFYSRIMDTEWWFIRRTSETVNLIWVIYATFVNVWKSVMKKYLCRVCRSSLLSYSQERLVRFVSYFSLIFPGFALLTSLNYYRHSLNYLGFFKIIITICVILRAIHCSILST